MTTVATPQPRKAKPTVSRYGFAPAHPLEPERQAVVDRINSIATKLDGREDDLQADRAQALRGAMQMTLEDILATAGRIKAEKASLENDRATLMWDRHAELQLNEPTYLAAVEAKRLAYEKAIDKQIADWAAIGIDESSNPGAAANSANPAGAKLVLRNRARQEKPPLVAFGELNKAQANLNVLRSLFHVKPNPANVAVKWRPVETNAPSFIVNLFS